MKDYRIREYQYSDIPALQALWQSVFGDPPVLLERFFVLLPHMGTCCLAEADSCIVGAAYILNDFLLRNPGQRDQRCSYLYAVAAEESWRGNGIGRAVSVGAADMGRQAGAEIICTLPAELSLYDWYSSILDLNFVSKRFLYYSPNHTLLHDDFFAALSPVTEEYYLQRREELLQNVPHVVPGNTVFSFQNELCHIFGGGIYQWKDSLLCAYEDEGNVKIVEFLSADPAPPFWLLRHPEKQRYVCSDIRLPDDTVWNLTLD